MANRLLKESSPYLRQHAENPVDWYPWCDEAFNKATKEEKLLLISIGYSSCHWCHVMEHETFSDPEAAALMNRFFVCVKVDREERPDIDAVYMNAVQLMSGQGGWPLNCFVLPDGRPVYGGTYFPREQWMRILHHLNALWKDEKEKVLDYAERLTQGVQLSDLVEIPETPSVFEMQYLAKMVSRWKQHFDTIEGGPNRAPKFPLPNNYLFLLRYAVVQNDNAILEHVLLTLNKIAMGGIYDQLGGGITRYSTDMIWKVPHFEKMLYDNAQIISLYSEAYRLTKSTLYKEMIDKTIAFCIREWSGGANGGFFSAFDADSEGEEGKYYIWKKEELKQLLGEDYTWFADYYQLNQLGEWEGHYILLRRENDEQFIRKRGMEREDFIRRKNAAHEILLQARSKRTAPLLDDKILCSWNAMMITALCDAWKATGEPSYLKKAEETAHFILREMLRGDGGLYHCFHKNKAYVNGFLEDYSFSIEAFNTLFELSGNEFWLNYSIRWVEYCDTHFYDSARNLYFFTSSLDQQLISRKTEFADNVIPSSNSSMARALFALGVLSGNQEYSSRAGKMLEVIYPHMMQYASGYSNWAILLLEHLTEKQEAVVSGPHSEQHCLRLWSVYRPFLKVLRASAPSDLPLLKNRFKTGEDQIYICRNNSCNLPFAGADDALAELI